MDGSERDAGANTPSASGLPEVWLHDDQSSCAGALSECYRPVASYRALVEVLWENCTQYSRLHSFQRTARADLLQNGLVGSPCSPRDSQESSPTPQFKSINSSSEFRVGSRIKGRELGSPGRPQDWAPNSIHLSWVQGVAYFPLKTQEVAATPLREPLVRRQGSQVSMRVARGSASWLSSHGRGLGPRDERRRIDAFELWCWRRLLRVPWTARRANQSILKEISPGISLEGIRPALSLGGQATAWECSPGRSLCLTKSSACARTPLRRQPCG